MESNASRRQHYLSAMGIESWLPRQQLPGAAAGPVYVKKMVQHSAAPIDAVIDVPAREVPASARNRFANTMDSVAAPSAPAQSQHELASAAPGKDTTVSLPQKAATSTNKASFQLAFYPWAPDLLIVDQGQDARLQQQLISNLLFALGHTNLQRQPPDYFNWPMRGGRQTFALSPHEMVFGALQRMLEQHTPAHILLMGELAVQQVLGVDGDDEWVAGKVLEASPLYAGVTLLTTHSTTTLLEQPLLKAETWQHLQALRV